MFLLLWVVSLISLHYFDLRSESEHYSTRSLAAHDAMPFFPDIQHLEDNPRGYDSKTVIDVDEEPIGYVVLGARDVVGFSGPTNVLIAFDNNDRSLGIGILSSADTPAHVAAVEEDEAFFANFVGKTWEELAYDLPLDGVSGATLTSLAITKSVMQRAGGRKASVLFNDWLEIDRVRRLVPDCGFVSPTKSGSPALWECENIGGVIAQVFRTSPVADTVRGYQGPTDTLIALDRDMRVIGIIPDQSYDNEPYVDYVRDDEYFRTLFNGLTMDELAIMDLEQGKVEGVSGATMTSMGVAEGMKLAARAYVHTEKMKAVAARKQLLDGDAIGTIVVVLLGCLIGFTRLRTKRLVRIAFPIILIGYLGLINGDLLSQAQLVGWVRNGIPWRTATGLFVLSAAALLLPITTRRNIYCSHICPHGAAQQVLRKALPFTLKLPAPLSRVLRALPWILLMVCSILAMTSTSFSLVDLEPFDAWVFQVAGGATIVIAVVGLVASLFVPMAYCQYCCPTGALLRYLRLSRRSDRWTLQDWSVVVLVVLGNVLFFY